MKKLFLIFNLLFSLSISAMDISKYEARKISRSPGMLNLGAHILNERQKAALPTKNMNKFILNVDGENKEIPSYLVDSKLLKATPEQLQAFQNAGGKFDIIKYDNGEFGIKAMVPGKGGGPIGFAIGCFLGSAAVDVGANAALGAIETTVVATATTTGGPVAGGATLIACEAVRTAAQPAIKTASVKAGLGLGLTLMVLIPF